MQFYVEDGSKDDRMIKLAKDLIKTVDRMFESAPESSKEFAEAIKNNTDSTQEWHILNQYQLKELENAQELPSLNTLKFLYYRCKLESHLLNFGVPKATFHLETVIAWTNLVFKIEDIDLRRCYSI